MNECTELGPLFRCICRCRFHYSSDAASAYADSTTDAESANATSTTDGESANVADAVQMQMIMMVDECMGSDINRFLSM
jgi:hypothetical protein